MIQQEMRIQWVDIFKGLTIISVFLGHTTGLYNQFIYQFHMAAFFFISGYTTNLAKRNLPQTIWNKFCTILLPLLFVFIFCFFLLNLLEFFFPLFKWNVPMQDLSNIFILKIFFSKLYMGISWLGATWFLVVLFFCCILHKVLADVVYHQSTYFIVAFFLFFVGYQSVAIHKSMWFFDLIFIGQIYFMTGLLFKRFKIFQKIEKDAFLLGFVSITLVYYFGCINPITVDYPVRRFGNPFLDYFAAMNGVVFIYLFSLFFDSKVKKLGNVFQYVGRNTLPVLFFHFLFFKVAFLVLFIVGIVPLEYIQNFLPTEDIGNKYYVGFVIFSTLGSILLWKLLGKVYGISFFLGKEQDQYDKIYEWVRLSLFKRS